jgi:hypothetical protein
MKKTIMTMIIILLVGVGLAEDTTEEALPSFDQPILITSAGQSAEVQLASVLAKRAGLEADLSKLATVEDLTNKKTVILVLGVSLKGLGAAGLDMDEEKKRVRSLIKAAEVQNIPLFSLHLGGEARRGQLTDDLITSFLPSSRLALVLASANKDGLFTRICEENSIPLIEIEKTLDALDLLKQVFPPDAPKSPRFTPRGTGQ